MWKLLEHDEKKRIIFLLVMLIGSFIMTFYNIEGAMIAIIITGISVLLVGLIIVGNQKLHKMLHRSHQLHRKSGQCTKSINAFHCVKHIASIQSRQRRG